MFIFLTYNTLPATHECPQKIQPNRSSRLAGYRQHIYIYDIADWPAIGSIYMYDRMSCFIIFIWSMETSAQDYF